MRKLLPPIIESKIPAQKGDTIHIPFLHNLAVGINDYIGMKLKIKTISTNTLMGEIDGDKNGFFDSPDELKVGQFYKAQIAYVNNDKTVGYYSTVGIFKYTGEPNLYIEGFEAGKKNYATSRLIGIYEAPEDDPNEKAYYYRFNLYKDEELLSSTDEWLLHNSNNDTEVNSSSDEFAFDYILDSLSIYAIEYQITTVNDLVVSSPRYYLETAPSSTSEYEYKVNAISRPEIGGITLELEASGAISGRFQLISSNSQDDYGSILILNDFLLDALSEQTFDLGVDLTVQHGVSYRYGVRQIADNGLVSEIVYSGEVFADFEDLFLFDGERQLKIKFDPKISSFKNTILENKIDTIGGQYPFIFRNGRTKYKEFPISGLISYWMDNEEMFISKEELQFGRLAEQRGATNAESFTKVRTFSTNLDGDNIAAERNFKLAVLEWLNNGKPKLFRSPTEGNYIVRLLNTSLSPNDTLGRMLHTFSSTAYEVAEYNNINLLSYGFSMKSIETSALWRFYTANSNTTDLNAIWFRLYGESGSKCNLVFADGTSMEVQIGVTGMYENSSLGNPLMSVTGVTSMEYAVNVLDTTTLSFEGEKIKAISFQEYGAQFSGPTDILEEITSNGQELENILFLRLQYLSETEPEEANVEIDGVKLKLGITNVVTDDKAVYPDPYKQMVAGRLELTAADFDGRFTPSFLTIGDNVLADIYYKVKVTEVE